MNGQPHIHELEVRDHGSFWVLRYGDQGSLPDKPWFGFGGAWLRDWALRSEIRKLIIKHDDASQQAAREEAGTTAAQLLAAEMQPRDTKQWGSEQRPAGRT